MIKYLISIILILCMVISVIAFIDFDEKTTTPKLNLNLNIKENNGSYDMIINDIKYTSKIEIDSKGYNANNILINNNKSNILSEFDSFSFSFNDKIYNTIKNKNTSINIKIQIDGHTITKPEVKK